MLIVILMGIVTAASVYFLIETGKASRAAAAEVVLSRAWSNRFARQTLEEKKADFLEKNEKYHTVSEKKAAKKVKEWDKQIASYLKNEEQYMAGKKFTLLDFIPLLGYQFLVDVKLDGDSGLLRKLTSSCEHTGYVELERSQETGDKKNSSIYAYYLLASLISYVYIGIMLAFFVGAVTMAAGNEMMGIILPMVSCFGGASLYGYIPYDNLQAKATKRQEGSPTPFPRSRFW